MKITTIVGILVVIALVLGSTGVAFAATCDEDGPIQDRVRLQDGTCDRTCDGSCDGSCNGPYYGPYNGPYYGSYNGPCQ